MTMYVDWRKTIPLNAGLRYNCVVRFQCEDDDASVGSGYVDPDACRSRRRIDDRGVLDGSTYVAFVNTSPLGALQLLPSLRHGK
mmetsp:Transcript_21764/g.51371  ORF Transcript_21764/g.51371 Transcript_21764/m.51371 type:complete len:84 (+) Transcript_21764:1506-1757(+)